MTNFTKYPRSFCKTWFYLITCLTGIAIPFTSFSSGFPTTLQFTSNIAPGYENDVSWSFEDLNGNVLLTSDGGSVQTVDITTGQTYALVLFDQGQGWSNSGVEVEFVPSTMDLDPYLFPASAITGSPSSYTHYIDILVPSGECSGLPDGPFLDGFDVEVNSYAYEYVVNNWPSECCGQWSVDCYEEYLIWNYAVFYWALLPDGIPEIIPAVVFNDSRVFVDINTGENGDALGCAVADIGQTYMWFKFTAGHTNSLVSARREGGGNFNGVIEIYDAIEGNQILCQDDYSTANEVAVFPTEIGETYYIKVYHNGSAALSNSNISVGVAYVPTTELRDEDCGLMDITDATIIRSNWPPNTFLLQNWMFRFEELEPPYNVYEVISPNGSNPQFRWFWFPEREPGRTYEVRTRPRMYQGPTWADYGEACIIGTAAAGAGSPVAINTTAGSPWASEALNVQIWPNPSQGDVNVYFAPGSEDQDADIAVFDITGKEIDRVKLDFDRGAPQTISYSNPMLVPGIYLFHISTASGNSMVRLVVTK